MRPKENKEGQGLRPRHRIEKVTKNKTKEKSNKLINGEVMDHLEEAPPEEASTEEATTEEATKTEGISTRAMDKHAQDAVGTTTSHSAPRTTTSHALIVVDEDTLRGHAK